MIYRRIFLIVCDSMGAGQASDAAEYGTPGAATFQHIRQFAPSMRIPTLEMLGIEDIAPSGISLTSERLPHARTARLAEASKGKDTITGHWEMCGIITEYPFVTFEDGFPPELIEELERRTGRKVIGNKAASGTVILDELGAEEIADPNKLIVYTSADSVLQICGSEEVNGLDELYRCCEIAREMTLEKPEWKVGRVIARPYTGREPGKFVRTHNRKDYTVVPPKKTVLDYLKETGLSVIGIGKIHDIFAGCGITMSLHSTSSVHGMQQTVDMALKPWDGLCFTNLADFDVKYGHRRDPAGYAAEIEAFDGNLKHLISKMRDDDLLIITADHGNDPTALGSDHTRENVPLIMFSPQIADYAYMGEIEGFATIGSTILENFTGKPLSGWPSLLSKIS